MTGTSWTKAHPVKPHRLGRNRKRRGAALAEFALVMPVFLLAFVGMVEFGRAVMVEQIITNAAREGARRAIRPGESASSVTTAVTNYLRDTSVNAASNTVTLEYTANPSAANPTWSTVTSLSALPAQSAIRVSVSAKQGDVGWGTSWFAPGRTFNARVIMRRE